MSLQDLDWKNLVQGIAPVLGTALLGPLAGTAIAQLGAAILGKPNATEEEVATALSAGSLTGEQIVAMKTADIAFETRMRELDIDLAKLNQAADEALLKDVQDARARQVQTKDLMPNYIFWLMAALYAGSTLLLYFGPTPTDDFTRALLVKAYSIIEVGFTAALFFFVGSSNGSKRSGDAVRKIAEQAAK